MAVNFKRKSSVAVTKRPGSAVKRQVSAAPGIPALEHGILLTKQHNHLTYYDIKQTVSLFKLICKHKN